MFVRSHYDNLQVARNAGPEVIKGAYKYLSQKWHPDKNPINREEAERNLKIINQAYEILSDPELRIKHDRWIRSVEAEEARSKGAQHRESDNHDQTSSDASTDAAGYENRTQPTPDPKDKSARVEGSSVTLTAVIGFGFILSAIFNFWHGNFGKGVLTAAMGTAFLFGSWLIKVQWEREYQTRAAKDYQKAPMFVQIWSDIEAFIEGFRKGLNDPEKPARERAAKKSKEAAASVPTQHTTRINFWGRLQILASRMCWVIGILILVGCGIGISNYTATDQYAAIRIQSLTTFAMGAVFLTGGVAWLEELYRGGRPANARTFARWFTQWLLAGAASCCAATTIVALILIFKRGEAPSEALTSDLFILGILGVAVSAIPFVIISTVEFLLEGGSGERKFRSCIPPVIPKLEDDGEYNLWAIVLAGIAGLVFLWCYFLYEDLAGMKNTLRPNSTTGEYRASPAPPARATTTAPNQSSPKARAEVQRSQRADASPNTSRICPVGFRLSGSGDECYNGSVSMTVDAAKLFRERGYTVTGPCDFNGAMSDQDRINCGRPPLGAAR